MKVQEALKAAIEALKQAKDNINHNEGKRESNRVWGLYDDAERLCKSALSDIEKCEPVAEALHERNRLGYAVVDVIGTLDEIIENAQEVEVDDFLHIAIPIDMWHELQDALEEMPKRAELYTSPISKEWLSLSDKGIEDLAKQNKYWYGFNSDRFDWRAYSSDLIYELKQLNVPEKG